MVVWHGITTPLLVTALMLPWPVDANMGAAESVVNRGTQVLVVLED